MNANPGCDGRTELTASGFVRLPPRLVSLQAQLVQLLHTQRLTGSQRLVHFTCLAGPGPDLVFTMFAFL